LLYGDRLTGLISLKRFGNPDAFPHAFRRDRLTTNRARAPQFH
jgi:hypothetical protein